VLPETIRDGAREEILRFAQNDKTTCGTKMSSARALDLLVSVDSGERFAIGEIVASVHAGSVELESD